jgi:N-acetylmuramoyl-L-alanine amidase
MSAVQTGPIRPRHPTIHTIGALLLVIAAGLLPGGAVAAGPPTSGLAAAESGYAIASTAASVRPVLRYGSRGTAVVTLQRRLASLRYDVGTIDGIFGSNTYHAVVAFQKVNGLGRDGIVGPLTWAALDRPVIPRPRYWHSGYGVEVNLTRQVLYLTRQGAIVRIVDASSGTASTPTPRGNFSVIRRIDGWRQSSLGLLWRPNYFYRGYAVHGSTSVPPYPASHGCVRVTIASMNRLWSILRIGTPVHIYR